jgi:hypothetical protein
MISMYPEGSSRKTGEHGYDAEVLYLGLGLDTAYVEGFTEGCLERIGEEYPDEEQLFQGTFGRTREGVKRC